MTRLVDGGVEGEEYGLYSIADSDRRVVGAFQTLARWRDPSE